MVRLQSEHPDRFTVAQLRTMQRRVKEWRGIMAKSWSTLGLMKSQRHPVDCRNWR